MNTYQLKLDLNKGPTHHLMSQFGGVTIRQGDKNGTTISADLYDHGTALDTSGLSAYFVMPLPDREHYYRKAASLANGTVSVVVDETEAASVAGKTDNAYFELLQGSTVIASTQSFPVTILRDALAGKEPGETYDTEIQEAIDNLNEHVAHIADTVEEVLEDHPEWTTTIQDGAVTPAKLSNNAFPDLTAGAADGITGGGPTDTAAWLQRTCPGTDGPAKVESIHGRTLGWNQMVSSYSQASSGTASLPAGEVSTVTGHVYYLSAVSSADTVVSNGSYIRFRLYTRASGSNRVIVTMQFDQSGEHKVSTIFTSQYDAVSNGTTSGVEGNIWVYRNNEGGSVTGTIDRLMLIDLTRMFGAGNEPATVAEFERMFPEPYYPYDAGSLLSVNMTGIETEDADGNALMTRPVPAATYFPDGMRSAGSVYDELTATSAITRIGERAYQSGDESDASVVTDGTVTHYALATPTTQAIDPALNLTYRTEQGGTERILHTEQTAPPTMAIAYGYTAESLLAAAASTLADPDGPTATTNHAVGSYLTMGGTLYRVTRAIATGEAIVPGTNVTATTVMAEILSLVQ